jgi:hypothetical protein
MKELKKLLENSPENLDTLYFINVHKGVELYIRRLLLIGLRLNEVKYETSEEVIKLSYASNREIINKSIELITKGKNTLADFEEKNKNLKVLLELFFDFTSIYRNRVVHGIYERIVDSNILKYCYLIDKYLIIEFEKTLEMNGYNSAFATPTEWGAKRSSIVESIDSVITRLKFRKISKVPKSLSQVKGIVDNLVLG